jgi:glycosyltransferase involved in cell wall biosynthesis
MKKIAIVGTVGLPACYGGFESLVENLTLNKGTNLEYKVFCSAHSYSEKLTHHNDAELIYLPLKANGIQSIPYDILSLIKCLFLKPDVVLILGVSGCIFLPFFRFFSKSKIVTNIDGLEWKRGKWGKWTRRFLKWSESLAVKFSDVIVTDNQAITDYVLEEYSVDSQTIAYGGDHALRDFEVETPFNDFALGLCRIEPENNVEMILEAYSQTDKKLKFVGNWDNSDFGRQLMSKYSQIDNIELLDPIYDLDELYSLRRQCSLYLHGHSAGGTNPSLVEMMHFAVPIIAFDCSFNRYSTDNSCHYFSSSEELISRVNTASKRSLSENALAMKNLANERYVWSQISTDYESSYI